MEINFIKAERALSPTTIDLADAVINPYKGCLIGCDYCYARSNKSFRNKGREWGEFVQVKENLPELLENELCNHKNITSIKRVLIGSITEPFQSIEETHHITCTILKILKSYNIPAVVLSKSNLIAEHLDLFDFSPKNRIYFTYNSEIVRELFERRSFPQNERLKTISLINQQGIDFVVYISPVFPFLTNIAEIFENLKGKVKKVYLEGYNVKLGNWNDVKKRLDELIRSEYERIFFNEDEYTQYWNRFIDETNELNKTYQFQLRYFIFPYDSYYSKEVSYGKDI